MTPCATGRHCHTCKRDVIDLSKHTALQIEHMLRSSSTQVCGKITRKSDGSIIVRPEWSDVPPTPFGVDAVLASKVTVGLTLHLSILQSCLADPGVDPIPWWGAPLLLLFKGVASTYGGIVMWLSGIAALWLLTLFTLRGGRRLLALAMFALGSTVTIFLMRSFCWSSVFGPTERLPDINWCLSEDLTTPSNTEQPSSPEY